MKEQFFVVIEGNPMLQNVNVKVNRILLEEDNDKLSHFYDMLDVDFIDIIEGENVDFVVDDEGLLKANNPVIALNSNGFEFMIAGKFLIGKRIRTDEGEEVVGFDSENELWEYLDKANVAIAYAGVVG